MQTTQVLQAVRLKGRATEADVAAAAGLDGHEAATLLGELSARGLVEEARGRFKLTAEGRTALDELLKDERESLAAAALTALYHEFDGHNARLKQVVTDWQLVDGKTPNDHSDPAYDAAVVARLVEVDAGFRPLLDRFVALAPRLAPYPSRFAGAIEKVQAGDHSWLARPLADSYHTVWFELHEDLIGLCGLSRVEEAAAGRAE